MFNIVREEMEWGGRKLTLETANVYVDDAYRRLNPDVEPGQYVLISVTDSGEGMTPDVIERAFEPFFTTKKEGQGTGLGLSQVYGFVRQSGGHLKIYSEKGHGSTLKIYLPRGMPAEADDAAPTQPRANGGPRRLHPHLGNGTFATVQPLVDQAHPCSLSAREQESHPLRSAKPSRFFIKILRAWKIRLKMS